MSADFLKYVLGPSSGDAEEQRDDDEDDEDEKEGDKDQTGVNYASDDDETDATLLLPTPKEGQALEEEKSSNVTTRVIYHNTIPQL